MKESRGAVCGYICGIRKGNLTCVWRVERGAWSVCRGGDWIEYGLIYRDSQIALLLVRNRASGNVDTFTHIYLHLLLLLRARGRQTDRQTDVSSKVYGTGS